MSERLLITFSGIDSSGKSTQRRFLATTLQQEGFNPGKIGARGGLTPQVRFVRSVLQFFGVSPKILAKKDTNQLKSSSVKNPKKQRTFRKKWLQRLFITVALIDLWWLCVVKIRWLLQKHKIVLCDRFLYDTLIDFRVRFPDDNINSWVLWQFLEWAAPTPDLAFLLKISMSTATHRHTIRDASEVPPSKLEERLQHYDLLSEQQPNLWQVLDGHKSQEELIQEVYGFVQTVRDLHA